MRPAAFVFEKTLNREETAVAEELTSLFLFFQPPVQKNRL
jgi:hypothetical protein